MFGYVSPLKCELKVKELASYKAYYCGLCKTISSRYGQTARLTLNYDCSFLGMLLSSLDGKNDFGKGRCAYKPFNKPMLIAKDSLGLSYAADVNVLLAYNKLEDDWRDEKSAVALVGMTSLKSAASKATAREPEVYKAIHAGIGALSRLEDERCADLDAPANEFACIMRTILCNAPTIDETTSLILGELGYHLGRWIYLIDAWDDRTKDAKSGSYNAFTMSGAGKDRAEFLLNISLNEARKAYDLLNLETNKGVLDNIMYLGMTQKTIDLLKGEGQ